MVRMELNEAIKHLKILKIGIGYLNFLAPEEDKDLVDIEALDTVLKELDRLKSLDIYKLIEDYETGQLISIEKVENIIEKVRCETTHSYNDWKYDEKVYRAEHNMINIIEKELKNKE